MKKLIFLILLISMYSGLNAQNITISFQPQVTGTLIDSIWVTNLKTDQKVKLLGNEFLVLSQSTGIKSLKHVYEKGYLYPDPCNGYASLSFSTSLNQKVEVRISNISGHVVGIIRQELSPGQHTFKLKFPIIGHYVVSVLKDYEPLSFKAVYSGVQMQECKIEYSGSLSPEKLKSAVVEKTLSYKQGDILHYSIFSAKNNTIVTDSPSATKVYSVDFYECIDFDKNYYKIVKIGSQVWMAENLKTTKYRDGFELPNVMEYTAWRVLTSGAYCWYNNDASNKKTYGAFYNWYAVNTSQLCPAGWHVPSDAEWTTLENYLITNGYNYDGTTSGNKIAKSLATATGWTSYSDAGIVGNTDYPTYRNKSGFSGLPGGMRNPDGAFVGVGGYGLWWSSTEYSTTNAWTRGLYFEGTSLNGRYSYEGCGFSVRCLRD
jgi:uncharacterized protein (TIGR02145 family)